MRIKSGVRQDVEYHGQTGLTGSCIEAITNLIQCGVQVLSARLLTFEDAHSFVLNVRECDFIAIRSGFSSGYSGEGPRGLSTALQLLQRHGIEIEEVLVSQSLFHRLDTGGLSEQDLAFVNAANEFVRPMRWHDYVRTGLRTGGMSSAELKNLFPAVIPFRLLDSRLIDLALKFELDRDAAIMTGYRRLETLVRQRCSSMEGDVGGSRLFAKAFQGEDSALVWRLPDPSEAKGRGAMFSAIYMAFRNARAHSEVVRSIEQELREFMLLNELFLLESEAEAR